MRFLVMVLLVLALPFQAEAADIRSRVMMILDGSGSMWGRIDGKPKITIAKDVMAGLIRDLDPKTDMGLMAYGHRRKGDCRDIAVLSPVGRVDKRSLIAKVRAISPKGKTPISQSLIRASNKLGFRREQTAIVLVSDGLETCEGDPCAVARSLKMVNAIAKTYVIGFDVTEEEYRALQCIATETGGKFYRANNARELNSALRRTLADVRKPAPRKVQKPVPAKPARSDSKVSAPMRVKPAKPAAAPARLIALSLHAKLCASCDRLPAIEAHWNVRKDGKVLYDGLGVLYSDGPTIAPGSYDVTVRYHSSALVRRARLEIGKDGKQVGAVNLNGGSASLFAYATDRKTVPANPIFYQFYPFAGGKAQAKPLDVSAHSNGLTWLPAGRYRVVATHDTVKASAEIEIRPGQTTKHSFDMRIGFLKPAATVWSGGPAAKGTDYEVYASKADAESGKNRLQFGLTGKSFALKPGSYFVKAVYDFNNNSGARVVRIFPAEVGAGERAEPVFNLDAGLLKHEVTAKGGKFFAFQLRFLKLDNGGGKSVVAGRYIYAKGTQALEPGRYVMEAANDGGTYRSKPFDVMAGRTTRVEMAIP
ncbi:MAG: hypothetical protein C0606_12415 [Hyphomicrobiales bacterium]|nr:MAG: hypothetical protein C0606_12415 [Hyphomicrobiales bacterium]